MSVRVRYAPSPTGSPHVGNIRTALFNHLFARHHKGVHIVRIEDTDRTRYVPGCEEEIVESLQYVGVEWQEGPDIGGPQGPYRQSERKEAGLYQPYIDKLLESGAGYWAFDTSEELAEMREYQQINKQPIGYFGGVWRDAPGSKVEEAKRAGVPGVIRLRIPRDESILVEDAIRGRVEIGSNGVDDPVLIKADGMPTYHFAAMVDDHLMGITHVFRGEEWISSAPKHIVLIRSLGWQPPVFVHVPVIKGKDGSKLSKRHGDTACLDFRRAGYLSEALANFIALIGWSPGGDRELMSMDEMAEAFDLKGIQPSPGVFDIDKLTWMNGHYIRQKSPAELAGMVADYSSSEEGRAYWQSKGELSRLNGMQLLALTWTKDAGLVSNAVALEQERVTLLAEFGEACAFFFVDEVEFDPKAVEKWKGQEHIADMFSHFRAFFSVRESVSVPDCEALLREYQAKAGFDKLGPVVHPTRVALTGKTVGPGLFELMSALGPARLVARLERAQDVLS